MSWLIFLLGFCVDVGVVRRKIGEIRVMVVIGRCGMGGIFCVGLF